MKRKLSGFILAGGTAFLAGAAALKLSIATGVSPMLAQVPAFAVAVTVSWLINRNLAFSVKAGTSSLREYGLYIGASTLGLGLNMAGYTASLLLGVTPLAALAIGTATGLVANFLIYDRVIFRN
ncbi:MAG: GtrA family protein [Pacificimonas sp.]